MDVPSPCTKVCRIAPAGGLCEGCGRTLAEIAGWLTMSPAGRRQVVEASAARLMGQGSEQRV